MTEDRSLSNVGTSRDLSDKNKYIFIKINCRPFIKIWSAIDVSYCEVIIQLYPIHGLLWIFCQWIRQFARTYA